MVVVNYYVSYSLVSKMKEISDSYHEFRQFKMIKNPIHRLYMTLFLITVVIVFLAYGSASTWQRA